ncbi:unnamed protein product [Polarella glacialis]|uniref:Uncharacterized protein n=1 Tax=Polarella glacialis TaxID=89957 RepID=A0A813EH48_POLGL|nr:unnamed protein product [Polarella glacialis]
MHFDSQESWEDCAAFPFVSTILYLDDRGPPTMMTSKSLADLPFADPNTGPDNDTIFLSWPERNHLLQFSGDLYHGIHMHQGIVRPKDRSLRAIALFNFWPHVHPDTADDVQDPIWEQQVGKSADVPVHVHELPPAKKSDKDRWTAEGEEFFGEELILKLKYRVPGGRSSIHGCKLDEATWVRTCADGSVNSTLIAVPHGIEQMSMSGESKFEGGIWGRGLGDDSDDDDDHDEF